MPTVQLVLANSRPPVAPEAKRHSGVGPHRLAAAAAATPMASNASRPADPCGPTGPNSASRLWASATNPTCNTKAFEAKRHNHRGRYPGSSS